MSKLPNISPIEILIEEFIKPLNLTNSDLPEDIKDFLENPKPITPELSKSLSEYFDISENFFLGLQKDYDNEEKNIAI